MHASQRASKVRSLMDALFSVFALGEAEVAEEQAVDEDIDARDIQVTQTHLHYRLR